MANFRHSVCLFLILLLCGDVELNPGPPRGRPEPKPDKTKVLQDKVEANEKKLEELETLANSQKDLIQQLQDKLVKQEEEFNEKLVKQEELSQEKQVKLTQEFNEKLVKQEQDSREKQVNLTKLLQELETENQKSFSTLETELQTIKSKLSGIDDLGSRSDDTSGRVAELENEVSEILEKLWELDKSWKNNLVFYGIKSDPNEDPATTERIIHDVIHKRMHISREITILRVKRAWNGPEVRGSKPITVYFERWQDKDEVLRKSKMLKGSNIFIGEDFSRRVKDQRAELQKFMRTMKRKKPNSKYVLQYDKLFVDKDIFIFNEVSGRVELVNESQQMLNDYNTTLVRKKSSGRRRLQKSHFDYASDTDLDQSDYPESPQKSPIKTAGSHSNLHHISNTNGSPVKHNSNGTLTRSSKVDVDEDSDENLVDYNDVPSMSPVRRLSAVIPATIPE